MKMHHSGFNNKIRLFKFAFESNPDKKIGFIAEKVPDNCSINHLGFMISYTIYDVLNTLN